MGKIKVDYQGCTPEDIDFLRRFEREIQKAMPTVFGLMTDAAWEIDPIVRSQRYFRLFVKQQPEKVIGEFGKRHLENLSTEEFYHKLEEVGFTSPAFRPKNV